MEPDAVFSGELRSLQHRHDELYKKALEEFMPQASKEDDVSELVKNELDPFSHDLSAFSKHAKNGEEYKWVSDAIVKWQMALNNMNVPREIPLHRPSVPLQPLPSPRRYLSEDEIRKWHDDKAYQLSRDRSSRRAEKLLKYIQDPDNIRRIAERPEQIYDIPGYSSVEREAENDWWSACVELSIAVFTGEIDFVRQICKEQYWRLEQQWFEHAKTLWAYNNYLRRGEGWGEEEKMADFYTARSRLVEYLEEPKRKRRELILTPQGNI